MGMTNLERDEIEALKAIDGNELGKLVDKCLDEGCVQPLRDLRLDRCGLFVANCLRDLDKALVEYKKARSPKKRDDTYHRALKAGSDLQFAFDGMKCRSEQQEQESKLFFVDDHIIPPNHFTESLSVSVTYRWREVEADDWKLGTIRFLHKASKTIDHVALKSKRKQPAWKVEQEQQDWLYGQWEDLMRSGLHSLQEFFRGGGKGSAVPASVKAKTDASGALNNHSTNFWL